MAKASHATLVQWELDKIEKEYGVLRPKQVWKFAKDNPKSALHKEFPWDLRKAAEERWTEIARRLIKVHVTILPAADNTEREVKVSTFQSLPKERTSPERGYRRIATIIRKEPDRMDLLRYTIQRLKAVREVWIFAELAEVAAAIDRAVATYVKDDAA